MARVVSADDAKRVIEQCKEILNTHNSIMSRFARCKSGMEVNLTNLCKTDFFTNYVKISFFEKGSPKSNKDFDNLLQCIFGYYALYEADSDCKRIYQMYSDDILANASRAQVLTRSLGYFLTSADDKRRAEKAYDNLCQHLTGDFKKASDNIFNYVNKAQNINMDGIRQYFLGHKTLFSNVLSKVVNEPWKRGKQVPQFATVLKYHEQLNKLLSDAEALELGCVESIKKNAADLVMQDVMGILSEVSVDELNNDKKGIRVKLLKDAGYDTIAKVYNLNARELSSIKGISEEAGQTIINCAREYAVNASKSSKIQLSPDDANDVSTALICNLYKYKLLRFTANKVDECLNNYGEKLKLYYKILAENATGVRYVFLGNEDREVVREAYEFLVRIAGDPSLTKASEMCQMVYKDSKVSSITAWKDFERNSVEYYKLLEDIVPGILGNDDKVYGLPEELAEIVQNEILYPEGLKCTLRRYQEWGVKYILHQKKVLLGDEMGLGKTVQAIAAMVSLANTGATHFVVVCPAGVLENWSREITKFSFLKVMKVHGNDKTAQLEKWKKLGGVAVTTFETTKHFEFPEEYTFNMLVVDEAHYVKNDDALRTKNVKALCKHAERILFMTGTALENKVDEMIRLVEILRPDIAAKLERIAFMSTAPEFKNEVAPVYYRRKREDVLTELPEMTINREWCTLGEVEKAKYKDSLFGTNYADIRQVSWNVDNIEESAKAKRMMEIVNMAAEDKRKIIVFSFFLNTMKRVQELLGDKCIGPIDGSVPPVKRQEIIDQFNKAPDGTVLLAQIQAGGTGLNIQAASVVILTEPQLKPSIENQAISRAYRMGQVRHVLVYYLLAQHTVDERIMQMVEEKQKIFDTFADDSVAAKADYELDETTFSDIVKEEVERIKNEGEFEDKKTVYEKNKK